MNIFLNIGMIATSIFVLFFVASATAQQDPDGEDKDETQKLIDEVNSGNATWKARRNFRGVHRIYMTSLTGLSGNDIDSLPRKVHEIPEDLPDTFDAREKWPNCTSIGTVRDQGACGSCWAVTTTEVITDRVCIHSNTSMNPEISTQDLLTCCGDKCGYGCNGGTLTTALQYYIDSGISTGGYHDSKSGCKPYTVPPCNYGRKGDLPSCTVIINTPECTDTCQEGYDVAYQDDKYYGKELYILESNVKQMQAEIFMNGPIGVIFKVYSDFITYGSGIYHNKSSISEGYHAAKIIGWGTESGNDYWLSTNSWGDRWGEKGFFRIRRGKNECDIEKDNVAALPRN